MCAMKLEVKNRAGARVLIDGILVPENVGFNFGNSYFEYEFKHPKYFFVE